MNQQRKWINLGVLAAASLLALAETGTAQVFVYSNNDLVLGFRGNPPASGGFDVVVDIGQASNYLNAVVGSRITVPNFSLGQLVPGCFSSLNKLAWSVVGYYHGTTYSGYPQFADTLWVTVPRSSTNVQSATPTRLDESVQQTVKANIASILADARLISQSVGTSNQYNTASFVREDRTTYANEILSVFMGSVVDPTMGTLQDSWPEGNLEVTTPAAFNSVVRSDLYEVRPLADSQGNPIIDPHTGTNGLAYYVGYFEFNSNGTMTFNRAAAAPPAPPAPVVSITRSGNVSTISFGTTNGASYTLYYTNSTGLTQPVASWPSAPLPITGNGQATNFTDVTADSNRFYRVGAH
jgi:hypothetical protein